MSRRIAEFDDSDDAYRFCKMKGADYTVVAGIQRMWAVMPRERYNLDAGPFEPSDAGRQKPYNDPDEDQS